MINIPWIGTIFAGDSLVFTAGTAVAESPAHPCSFCDTPTNNSTNEKHGWHICPKPSCNMGAAAQVDRIYAGLVDCPETRRDARAWAERQI